MGSFLSPTSFFTLSSYLPRISGSQVTVSGRRITIIRTMIWIATKGLIPL